MSEDGYASVTWDDVLALYKKLVPAAPKMIYLIGEAEWERMLKDANHAERHALRVARRRGWLFVSKHVNGAYQMDEKMAKFISEAVDNE